MYKRLAVPCPDTLQIAVDTFPAVDAQTFADVFRSSIATHSHGDVDTFGLWMTALGLVPNPDIFGQMIVNSLDWYSELSIFIENLIVREQRESSLAIGFQSSVVAFPVQRREPLCYIFRSADLISMISMISMITMVCNAPDRYASYDTYKGLATLAAATLSVTELTALFVQIDFDAHPGHSTVAAAFYSVFVASQDGFVDLAVAGVASQKMGYLSTDSVTRNNPIQCAWIDKLLGVDTGTVDSILRDDESTFFYTRSRDNTQQVYWPLVLTYPFISLGQKYAPIAPDKPLFLKILLYLTCRLNSDQQLQFMADSCELQKIENLHQGILGFYNTYWCHRSFSELDVTDYRAIFTTVSSRLVEAAKGGHTDVILKSLQKSLELPLDYIDAIMAYPDAIGEMSSGVDAVKLVFEEAFSELDPLTWKPENLLDGIERLYFQVKYPLPVYIDWMKRANVGKGYITAADIDGLFESFEAKKKGLSGYSQLVDLGYRFLQHGQAAAILHGISKSGVLSLDGLGGRRVFFKMGTGQGKSVVLAMLALRLAQENQRVVIYTCYQHLAQRDYDGFKDLYTNFGDAQDRALSARLQSDDRHKGLVQGDVVYANIGSVP